ncbi:DUF4317 domain-containing protein [Amphibacillus sp. MSJ-3]|uniref:DUF4317 domain-containing protein n=1 Tax=Amphibacillus sp. MSJ-3 TaxID=2841505 RepID=UPI001C0EC27C|nr:DUF4317 domain-containing protein [Amphibacillus sp. MSJ-3]MBU5593776.1 DUF4317 domain-containing protein [Amphibacillus sp. MSJ-3]
MNKKEIAEIRRQFKKNNELLHISEIFNVYVMKESSEIYHQQSQPFEILDSDEQELFLNNFKKVLTGGIDEKLFELKFQTNIEDSSQLILHQALLTDDKDEWKAQMIRIVEKMLQVKQYEMDIVITFIKGEYFKPIKRQSTDDEESEYNSLHSHTFILSSMNQTQDPKKELHFDYIEKAFKYNLVVDPVINLQKPIGGFLFPCFIDHAANVNRVLYSAPKTNEPDESFIEEVLNAEETVTAKEDKIIFEEVVRDAIGHELNTSTLANIYQEIHRVVEEDEEDSATLDYKDVESVLKHSGIEHIVPEKVETAFNNVIDDSQYELKAKNIVPKFKTKSIKINTEVANIAVSPEDLHRLKQVSFNGKRYLMIEVEEDTIIDGFTMLPEAFGSKVKED